MLTYTVSDDVKGLMNTSKMNNPYLCHNGDQFCGTLDNTVTEPASIVEGDRREHQAASHNTSVVGNR